MRGLKLMMVLTRPDAATLSAGGALAQYAEAGAEIDLLVARLDGVEPLEVLDAARRAGARDVYLLGLGERRLEDVDPCTVVERLVEHIRLLRPEAVVAGPAWAAVPEIDAEPWDPDLPVLGDLVDAAVVAAADPSMQVPSGRPVHRVWIVDAPDTEALAGSFGPVCVSRSTALVA